MKTCTKCKVEKPLSGFHKRVAARDGLQFRCKSCQAKGQKKYRQTVVGKEVHIRDSAKYFQTLKGKAVHRRNTTRYRIKFPEKRKAYNAVSYATAAGKLQRPNSCEGCKNKGFVEAHHRDYSRPLYVTWLCDKCHKKLHRKGKVCV